jgi:hypothetical protein
MKAFTGYMFVLPSGAGGYGADPERLRSAAELECWEGWLLGCRDHPRPRRRVVVVTPLGMVGTPDGTLVAALARAGARDGCDYVLVVTDEPR